MKRLALNSTTLCIAGIIFILALTIIVRTALPINHDVSWYLYATEKWRAGAVLYEDIIEVNPPLAFWLTLPGLYLADMMQVSAKAGLITWLLLLTVASLAMCAGLLRGIPRLPHSPWPILFILCIAILIIPGSNFGQREHFLVIFLLPYLILAVRRFENVETSRSLAVLVGIWAAIGLCLKPHFLLVPIAVETALLIRRRSPLAALRSENIAMATAGFAYAVAVVLLHPEFFERILPLGVAAYTPYYGFPWQGVLQVSVMIVTALVLLCAIAMLKGTSAPGAVMLIAAAAMLVGYFAQFKGYSYHLLPAFVFCALAAVWMVYEGKRPICVAAVIAVALVSLPLRAFDYTYLTPAIVEEIKVTGARSIFIATSNVSISFPMVTEYDLEWSSRYPAQWLLPYAADMEQRKHDGAPISPLAEETIEYARKTAVDDLIARPPQWVVVDEKRHKPYFTVPFDYLAFYAKDPRFDSFWSEYKLDHRLGAWAFYRRDSARSSASLD